MMKSVCCLILCMALPAHAWETPARGSADRQGLMDALRPKIEDLVGAPVEFVVGSLRVSGSVAFGELRPQRKGGGGIDIRKTPLARTADTGFYDESLTIYAFYRKSGRTWAVVDWSMGATDAWFTDPAYCPDFRAVIPEYCGN